MFENTAPLLRDFKDEDPTFYWMFIHMILFSLLVAVISLIDVFLKSYFYGVLALYWPIVFILNKVRLDIYKYKLRKRSDSRSIVITDDEKYVLYHIDTEVILIQPWKTRMLSMINKTQFGTNIRLQPYLFTWLMDGLVIKMSEKKFYECIKSLNKVDTETELWKQILQNSTDSDVFESIIREQRVIECI